MKTLFLITSVIFGAISGCKGGSTSFTHNQSQVVNINDPKCTLQEFVSCDMFEVRQFCAQNPDQLLGTRDPNCETAKECQGDSRCPS